jgi:hypothetical protein
MIPGLMLPTQKAMISGSPRDSAYASMTAANQSQTNANKLMSGGKYKYKYRGKYKYRTKKHKRKYRGGTVTVPQFTMLYNDPSGPGTGPNSQIQGNSQTSTQQQANAALDCGLNNTCAKGGSRRRRNISRSRSRKGGNPNWHWGCKSGGKKHKTRKNK